MATSYSQACIDHVMRSEDEPGFLAGRRCTHLKAYKCPAGIDTCGWGTTRGVTPATVFTQEEADRRLREDLEAAAAIVRKHVTVPLTQGQFDALTAFVQNVGPGQPEDREGKGGKDGFVWLRRRATTGSPRHSTMLRHLLAADYEGACGELTKWVFVNGEPSNGLRKRRQREQELFQS
jgi:lysozyme